MRGTSRRVSSRKFWLTSAVGAVAVLALAGTAWTGEGEKKGQKDEVFKATDAITLPNGQIVNAFDISFDNPDLRLYILADRTNKAVDVVDTTHNTVVTQVKSAAFPFKGNTGNNSTSGPDGVMFVGNTEIWAGDGDSTLKIFRWPQGTLIGTPISTGGAFRVDEMCAAPPPVNLAMVANNAEMPFPFATILSTTTRSILKKITFNGLGGTPKATNGAEQCQWDPRTGKFYISIPEIGGPGDNSVAGGVAVIDPVSLSVETTFIINHDDCAGPQGLAIGPDHQILLGCNSPSGNGNFSTVIISDIISDAGKIIKTLDNESGADEVWFNSRDGQYFLARSSAAGPAASGFQQLGVVDANVHKEGIAADKSIPTAVSGTRNAHSVAADPHKNQVYLPIPGNIPAGPGGVPPAKGVSTICSSVGGNDDQGCIAVFTAKRDDHASHGRERDKDDDHQE